MRNDAASPPVFGFIGDSGSGKTTLIERLITRFSRTGLRVAAIKHAHHGFDIDRPGKDSYRFRSAGAGQVLLASDRHWVLMGEEPMGEEPMGEEPIGEEPPATSGSTPGDTAGYPPLARQLARLGPCDLVLVEGFRGQAGVAYIEVRRGVASGPSTVNRKKAESSSPGFSVARPPAVGVVAYACDAAQASTLRAQPLPVLDIDDIEAIGRFVAASVGLRAC
jgi:molybdopterin-guanine dinucleotide biosynthesis protein B